MSYTGTELHADAKGLKLHRIVGEDLRACEMVMFVGGRDAVDVTLRRAAISGRVDIGGKVNDHFADVHATNGDLIQTVALDAASYGILKNKWMRCRMEPAR